ncbi:MAG: cyclase family protein [Verrucomicrobia bacterium]|nr:cyclase family protein [Verrucomicrobiota bacterium]
MRIIRHQANGGSIQHAALLPDGSARRIDTVTIAIEKNGAFTNPVVAEQQTSTPFLPMRTKLSLLSLLASLTAARAQVPAEHVQDLSLPVSPAWPCVWPVGMMQHITIPRFTFGPGAFHRETIVLDEHTGTQWDAPAHFVPPPGSGLPGAGPMGLVTGEKVPVWQFVGEACVIDVTAHRDDAPGGSSFLIRPELVKAWEQKHRPLRAGDVVLFRSDYSDTYYQPLNRGGARFVVHPLTKRAPAWPAPAPETMKYLGEKGIMSAGLDGASMGPMPDLAVATHQAGGAFGMIWIECGSNFKALPPTGAFYALLPAKHAGGSGGEARVLAITEPKIATQLIAAARARRVTDVSVTLSKDLPVTWQGHGPGEEAQRYLAEPLNQFEKPRGPYMAWTHTFDSQAGTHVVTPAFTLPPPGFDAERFAPEIRELRSEFEKKHGPLGHSTETIDKLPLNRMIGTARVIDVTALRGTTDEKAWPASPLITARQVLDHEKAHGPIAAGEIVLFRTGYTDAKFKPLPDAPAMDECIAAPLAGKSEGWPALSPEAIALLAERGVRCAGIDAPTAGGVRPEASLMTYWTAAKHHLLLVEFLTGLGSVPEKGAWFLFAPIKIEGIRSGHGRALVLQP